MHRDATRADATSDSSISRGLKRIVRTVCDAFQPPPRDIVFRGLNIPEDVERYERLPPITFLDRFTSRKRLASELEKCDDSAKKLRRIHASPGDKIIICADPPPPLLQPTPIRPTNVPPLNRRAALAAERAADMWEAKEQEKEAIEEVSRPVSGHIDSRIADGARSSAADDASCNSERVEQVPMDDLGQLSQSLTVENSQPAEDKRKTDDPAPAVKYWSVPRTDPSRTERKTTKLSRPHGPKKSRLKPPVPVSRSAGASSASRPAEAPKASEEKASGSTVSARSCTLNEGVNSFGGSAGSETKVVGGIFGAETKGSDGIAGSETKGDGGIAGSETKGFGGIFGAETKGSDGIAGAETKGVGAIAGSETKGFGGIFGAETNVSDGIACAETKGVGGIFGAETKGSDGIAGSETKDASGSGIFGATTGGSIFGSTAPSTSIFGSSGSIFAPTAGSSTPSHAFGASTTPNPSIFGASTSDAAPSGGIFGAPASQSAVASSFGGASTTFGGTSGGIFGSNASTNDNAMNMTDANASKGGIFGVSGFGASTASVVDNQPNSNPFGGKEAQSSGGIFGNSSAAPFSGGGSAGSETKGVGGIFGAETKGVGGIAGSETKGFGGIFGAETKGSDGIAGSETKGAPGSGIFGATTGGSIFGSTAPSTSIFGSSGSIFAPTAGSSTPSHVFGASATPNPNPNPSPSIFGASTSDAAPSGGVFGAPASQPAFASSFGGASTPFGGTSGGIFGSNASTNDNAMNMTDTNASSSGIFGGSGFGASTASVFGNQPNSNPFGGKEAQSSGGIFGNSSAAPFSGGGGSSMFGAAPTSKAASPAAFGFGQSSTGFGQSQPQSSIFGQQPSNPFNGNQGSAFGNTPTQASSFGAPQPAAPTQASSFGAPQPAGSNSFGGFGAAQNTQPQNNPFGNPFAQASSANANRRIFRAKRTQG